MKQAEFDQYADAYDKQHAANIAITGESPDYFAEYKAKEAGRIAHLNGIRPAAVMDFGAGIGNTLPHIQAQFPDAKIYAADVSKKSLAISEQRFPGLAESVLIKQTIPLPDQSIDIAFTACVFHHIPPDEHIAWLAEIRRVVKPGGMFILFEHNPLNPLTVQAVNTCPFDENAILIRSGKMQKRIQDAEWRTPTSRFHVFFPNGLKALRPLEAHLRWLPLGGQYSITAMR